MGVVEGGGSRCSVVCPCAVLPQTFLSDDNGIFFRMVLHLLCLEVQVLLHQQGRRPKSSWSSSQPQGEASRRIQWGTGNKFEHPVLLLSGRKRTPPAHFPSRGQGSFLVTRTTLPPCSRVTRGKSDSLRFLRSCHIKQDTDLKK